STLAIVVAGIAILAAVRRAILTAHWRSEDPATHERSDPTAHSEDPGRRALRDRVIAWIATGLFMSFMMIRYSEPIGRHIPRIDIGVFTWRMLTISTVIVALLAGACIELSLAQGDSIDQKTRRGLAILGAGLVGGALVFSVANIGWPMVNAPFFYPEDHHLNYAIIPRTAPAHPAQ